jgi:septal ring factor EnvC (AmiA/AmiB activator)
LQVATDTTNKLQEQLGQTTIDLSAAKEQITMLQKQLAGKRDEATSDQQALAALQKAHHASVKASIHCF